MINANIDILKMKTLFQERIQTIKTTSNPNGYSPRRCITNSKGEDETINSDDEYLYRHDIAAAEEICYDFRHKTATYVTALLYRSPIYVQ